jgi:hypothetical protein
MADDDGGTAPQGSVIDRADGARVLAAWNVRSGNPIVRSVRVLLATLENCLATAGTVGLARGPRRSRDGEAHRTTSGGLPMTHGLLLRAPNATERALHQTRGRSAGISG